MMNGLPLSASADAIKWIVDKLQASEADTGSAGLVPTLCFCFSYQTCDENGLILERYPHPFFDIGWYRPETASAQRFVELAVPGAKVVAPPDTLTRLEGKRLILETVEVGFPNPADKKVQLLKATANEL
jgi:hypothetical protein